jgi:hypothetical protein
MVTASVLWLLKLCWVSCLMRRSVQFATRLVISLLVTFRSGVTYTSVNLERVSLLYYRERPCLTYISPAVLTRHVAFFWSGTGFTIRACSSLDTSGRSAPGSKTMPNRGRAMCCERQASSAVNYCKMVAVFFTCLREPADRLAELIGTTKWNVLGLLKGFDHELSVCRSHG